MRYTIENLKNMTKEERIKVVKDPEFRKKLFEERYHYSFVGCTKNLEGEEILSLLDDDIIPYLESDKRLKEKIKAIITSNNPYINIFLSGDKALSLIVKEINTLRIFLGALDINFGKKYVYYLINNNIDITYLGYLNSNVQIDVLKDKELYDKLMSINLPKNFLSSIHVDTVNYLLQDKHFENLLINYDVAGLNYLFERGLSLPIYLQENKEIIDKFATIENVNTSYAYLERLGINNPYLKDNIMKKRKVLYKEKAKSIDSNLEIFSKYKDYLNKKRILTKDEDPRLFHIISIYHQREDCLRNLKRLTETVMLEMIVDYLFEDMTYNAFKNIGIILKYTKESKEELVSSDNLSIYNNIYNFYSLSFDEKLSFFNNVMEKDNMIEAFYDDFKNVLNHSYDSINNSLYDITSKEKVNTINDIPIYKLEGEPFYMLVHDTSFPRYEENIENIWHNKSKTASLSLIGDTHLQTYTDPNKNIILGFNNIDINYIMHVYKSDSFSAREYGTNKVQSIMSPEELLRNTINYNEILIKEDNNLVPSYIVCYDEVKPGDISASKELGNIPIVIIDTKKYNINHEKNDTDDEKYKSINESNYPISYRKGR